MSDLRWLSSHIGTLEDGIALVRSIGWNLVVENHNGKWIVKDGEKAILETDSRDSVDIFLYGMSLAYSVIPGVIIDQLREEFSD